MKDVIFNEFKKIKWEKLKIYQKPFLGGLLGAGLIVSYFIYKDYFPSTDNAYVNANIINMIPKVSGYITHIYVHNNQYVKKGDVLLEIDQKDYQLLLNQAKLDFKLAKKAAFSAEKDISQANANIIKAKANYEYTLQMRNRYTALYQQHAGSEEAQQKFANDFKQAQQALEQAQTAYHQAEIQSAASLEKVELAKTQLENAQNTFDSTIIKAPVTGYISNLNLQVGQLVAQGQDLFGMIDDSSWWIDSNFRETQISRIKPHQKVKISLDMYSHTYDGYVDSISYASGSTFSLLPAQNSSGNWVKVAQRFTVRVVVKDNAKFPLRVGASSTITVNTLS
jgi:membrane fusion protein (multidrug efflux system)